jgi:hypothetical protein
MVTEVIGTSAAGTASFSGFGGAHRLGPGQRKDLSIQVLARSQPVSHLAQQCGVSRKFLYHQADKANQALEDAFASEADDDKVLFTLPVTKEWLRSFVVSLALEGHSAYRGIGQMAVDLLDYHGLSPGNVHNILTRAVDKARAINAAQDLSTIRVGAHDEIYQAGRPVLVGAEVESTYCYLLAEAEHCDETTWGVHLLDLAQQGLHPDYTVADGGTALRAGQAAAWGSVPCHGDVFHAERELGRLATHLAHRATQCAEVVKDLQRKIDRLLSYARGSRSLSYQLRHAHLAQKQAVDLAGDVRLLSDWMQKDILSLAGPDLATRRELFDFVTEELRRREPLCRYRIQPLRRMLQRHRDDLLAFAAVLDQRLDEIAKDLHVPPPAVRTLCQCQGLDQNQPVYWQHIGRLKGILGPKFQTTQNTVTEAMDQTPRASSIIENLNSRLRNYFFLRRQLGDGYLDLLRFFLNHHRFLRSENSERVGKSPAELFTGRPHPHWLELLGFRRFHRN